MSGGRALVRSALILLMVIAQLVITLLLGAKEADADQPGITAVYAGIVDHQVVLIIDLPGVQQPAPPEAFSVTVHGISQSGQVGPLLSDELALSFVIDASEAGRSTVQEGARGAGTFLLAQPLSTRSALLLDASPPTVSSPLRQGPTATLRALTTMRPQGERRTSEALDLAMRELPPGTADPRMVVLYTGAPDAGGVPATDVVSRLHAAGLPLCVVAVVADGQPVPRYWSTVAAGTGGAAIAAPPSQVVAAFDQLASTLRTRYVMRFAVPTGLPATAAIRVDTPTAVLSTDVVVPAAASAPSAPAAASAPAAVAANPVGAVLALALGVGLVVLIRAVAGRRGRSTGTGRQRAEAGGRSASASAGRVWNIPARLDQVAEREQLLAAVRSTLDAGERALLHAPDDQVGTGTTTLVIEFAHRYQDRYDIGWWVSAEDPALVPDRLAELAEALGLANATDDAEPATARLLSTLSRRGRWLIVFDGAASPHQLARFLPGGSGDVGSGDVVVVSQEPGWREFAVPVLVGSFARTESVALLRSRLPYLTADEADRVSDALDDLPLALGPAAATLADTGMSSGSYLRQLSDRRSKLRPPGNGGSEAVAASWALTFDRLRVDDPAALALLTLVAWLGPEPVPLSLFTRHPDELPTPLAATARDPAELAARAVVLRRRGLARVARRSVWLHPVPAAMLVSGTSHERTDESGWSAFAVRLLRAAVPENPRSDPATWRAWRRLLPHVLAATDPVRSNDDVAAEVGWLLGTAGAYLHARGQPRAALALFEDADRILRRELGADHPDTLACARDLIASRQAIGRQESVDGV
jgi:hypothetical protein